MGHKIVPQPCIEFEPDGTAYGPTDYEQLSQRNKLILFHMNALVGTYKQNNPETTVFPVKELLEIAKPLADWMLKNRPQ